MNRSLECCDSAAGARPAGATGGRAAVHGAIQDERERAYALSAVAARLPCEQRRYAADALRAAGALTDKKNEPMPCVPWQSGCRPISRRACWRRHCGGGRDPRDRVLGFSPGAVVERLPADQPELLAEALRVAGALQDEGQRFSALSAVAERLPPDQPELLAEALRRRARSKMKWQLCVSEISEWLPRDQPKLLVEALRTAACFNRNVSSQSLECCDSATASPAAGIAGAGTAGGGRDPRRKRAGQLYWCGGRTAHARSARIFWRKLCRRRA